MAYHTDKGNAAYVNDEKMTARDIVMAIIVAPVVIPVVTFMVIRKIIDDVKAHRRRKKSLSC